MAESVTTTQSTSVPLTSAIVAGWSGAYKMYFDMTNDLVAQMQSNSTQQGQVNDKLTVLRAAQAALSDPTNNGDSVTTFYTTSEHVSFDTGATENPYAVESATIEVQNSFNTISRTFYRNENETWDQAVKRQLPDYKSGTYNYRITGNDTPITTQSLADVSGYKGDLSITSQPYRWTLSHSISSAQAYKYYQSEISTLEAELQQLSTTSQKLQQRLTQFNSYLNEAETTKTTFLGEDHKRATSIIANLSVR